MVHTPAPRRAAGCRNRFRTAAAEADPLFGVSWWLSIGFRGSDPAPCRCPAPRMLGTDEHQYRSVLPRRRAARPPDPSQQRPQGPHTTAFIQDDKPGAYGTMGHPGTGNENDASGRGHEDKFFGLCPLAGQGHAEQP